MNFNITFLLTLAVAVVFAAGAMAQTDRDPNPVRGGELLTDLDRYRLSAAREAALRANERSQRKMLLQFGPRWRKRSQCLERGQAILKQPPATEYLSQMLFVG